MLLALSPLLPQAIMLDIVVMLFHILRAYLPAELKWSVSRCRCLSCPLSHSPTC